MLSSEGCTTYLIMTGGPTYRFISINTEANHTLSIGVYINIQHKNRLIIPPINATVFVIKDHHQPLKYMI